MATPSTDLRDPGWGTPPWPEALTELRPHQKDALDEILAAFDRGTKLVVMEAPTGSGKTILAEAVRRALQTRAVYLCHTIRLQEQVMRDFGVYARLLKGRVRYTPANHRPDDGITCDDCLFKKGRGCRLCLDYRDPDSNGLDRCPYGLAKEDARRAPLSVLNLSYFLAESNGPGSLGPWPLGLLDECDQVEEVVIAHVQADLTAKRLETLRLLPPSYPVDRPDLWATWIDTCVRPAAESHLKHLLVEADLDEDDLTGQRHARQWTAFVYRTLPRLFDGLHAGTWMMTETDTGLVGRPIWGRDLVQTHLFVHAQRWLCFSATILDPEEWAQRLGLDPTTIGGVRVPSVFPVARRPVYLADTTWWSREKEAEALVACARPMTQILAAHPNDRILVHTVSRARMHALMQRVPSPRWIPFDDPDPLGRLERHVNGVLVGAALERGLDLPDALCRVVVVLKFPFASLGDPVTRARQTGAGWTPSAGQRWYDLEGLRRLIQMTGRGVRHVDDWCVTYILDAQATRVIRKYLQVIPDHWYAAIQRGLPSNVGGTLVPVNVW